MADLSNKVTAELACTLLTLSQTESVAETSRRLGISRPAVNAQIARLEKLLGGPLLGTSQSGKATPLGSFVLAAARRMLPDSHHAAPAQAEAPIRIGVSSIFVERFAADAHELGDDEVLVSSAVCTELVPAFMEHKLDVILVLDVRDHREKLGRYLVDEHPVDMTWITTADFDADPAKPIPLATWPGDALALRTLDKAGSDYKTMFASNDYFAKLAAVRSGQYVSMMPRRAMRAPFVEAQDARLPTLPVPNALIAVRDGHDAARMKRITAALAVAHLS